MHVSKNPKVVWRPQGVNPAVEVEAAGTLVPELPEKTTATTREVVRSSPVGTAIVLGFVQAFCFLKLREHHGALGAVATGIVVWVALMFGVGRGWVRLGFLTVQESRRLFAADAFTRLERSGGSESSADGGGPQPATRPGPGATSRAR